MTQRRRVTVVGASVVAPDKPTLTAPGAGNQASTTSVTVSATVTAGQVPDRVDFVLDPGGSEVVVATDSSSPYSQTWVVAQTEAAHTMVARFVYGSGHVDSDPVNVTIVAPDAPTLTAPTANGVLVGSGYTVSATVTAGQVPDRVDFVLDPGGSEVVVATDSSSPYSQTWTVAASVAIGEHTLVARFVYGSGHVDSTALPIVVLPAGTALALLGDYVSKTVNAVNTWTDISGNGRDFSFAGGAEATYQATGGPASQPDLSFPTGKAASLGGSAFAALTAADIFVVWKVVQADGSNGPWELGTAAATDVYEYADTVAYLGAASTTRQTCGTPAQDITQWHVTRITSTGSEYTVKVGAEDLFTTATNTVGFPATCWLGKNTTPLYLAGNIAALVMLDHKATAGELAGIKAFFASKYGALPGTA